MYVLAALFIMAGLFLGMGHRIVFPRRRSRAEIRHYAPLPRDVRNELAEAGLTWHAERIVKESGR